jgi:hypothetical protein
MIKIKIFLAVNSLAQKLYVTKNIFLKQRRQTHLTIAEESSLRNLSKYRIVITRCTRNGT